MLIYSPKYMSLFYSNPLAGRVFLRCCPVDFAGNIFGIYPRQLLADFLFVVFSFAWFDFFSDIKCVQCQANIAKNTLQ